MHIHYIYFMEALHLTVLHSLTGPVGQPFASRRKGQQFTPQGCKPHFGTGITC